MNRSPRHFGPTPREFRFDPFCQLHWRNCCARRRSFCNSHAARGSFSSSSLRSNKTPTRGTRLILNISRTPSERSQPSCFPNAKLTVAIEQLYTAGDESYASRIVLRTCTHDLSFCNFGSQFLAECVRNRCDLGFKGTCVYVRV